MYKHRIIYINISATLYNLYYNVPICNFSKKKSNFPTRPTRSLQYLSADWLFNLTGDTIDIHGNESDADIEFDHHRFPISDGVDSTSPDKGGSADAKIPLEYLRKGSGGEYDEENGYFYDTAWSAVITEGKLFLHVRAMCQHSAVMLFKILFSFQLF